MIPAQIAALLTVPLALQWAATRVAWVRAVSPVVLCYALGIAAATLGVPQQVAVTQEVAGVAVGLAIPLLLLSVDVRGWLSAAPGALASFGLCVICVAAWSCAGRLLFDAPVADGATLAGLLAATYTGGTANMAAVSSGLGVEPGVFVLLNAADVAVGSLWFLLLISVVPRVLARVLPATPVSVEVALGARPQPLDRRALWSLLAALICVGSGLGLGALAPASAREVVQILGITTAAIGASLIAPVRRLPHSHVLGETALLIFCFAAGAMADFGQIIAEGGALIGWVAFVCYGAALSHFALCAALRIDRDTAIITQTAAIMGPPLVPPVAAALGNQGVLLSGMTMGLLGYAVGNYLGLGLAWALG